MPHHRIPVAARVKSGAEPLELRGEFLAVEASCSLAKRGRRQQRDTFLSLGIAARSCIEQREYRDDREARDLCRHDADTVVECRASH